MTRARRGLEGYRQYYLPATDARPSRGAIKVTFYGTSTLLFDDGTTQILVDAFITRPNMATVLGSLESGEALIQTDPVTVDEWLARPEVGRIAGRFFRRIATTTTLSTSRTLRGAPALGCMARHRR